MDHPNLQIDQLPYVLCLSSPRIHKRGMHWTSLHGMSPSDWIPSLLLGSRYLIGHPTRFNPEIPSSDWTPSLGYHLWSGYLANGIKTVMGVIGCYGCRTMKLSAALINSTLA